MASLAARLAEHRAVRDEAKATFDAHYAALKADMEERGIAGRLADEAIDKALDVLDEAVAVVETHPAVVGGTFTALVLWILRNPIIAWITDIFGALSNRRSDEHESEKGA
ncbi:hypothetical protein EDF56_101669 [Novosphingobium sp. PhB165]|uniref:hypothetical protein n=1 Tax=Novosphingobium sp. PhB165 TaxID=2485105 RepID=UPI0010495530|nr:hypothetical protein [Novosphingobium sp. PhB165]TCM21992.1 hypothetical protein EDF56_101669 [Novosphingobium sp. PhB165]